MLKFLKTLTCYPDDSADIRGNTDGCFSKKMEMVILLVQG